MKKSAYDELKRDTKKACVGLLGLCVSTTLKDAFPKGVQIDDDDPEGPVTNKAMIYMQLALLNGLAGYLRGLYTVVREDVAEFLPVMRDGLLEAIENVNDESGDFPHQFFLA